MTQRSIVPGIVRVVDGKLSIMVGKRVGAISPEALQAFVHRTDAKHRRDSATGEWVFFTATQVLRFGEDVIAFMRETPVAAAAPVAKQAAVRTPRNADYARAQAFAMKSGMMVKVVKPEAGVASDDPDAVVAVVFRHRQG